MLGARDSERKQIDFEDWIGRLLKSHISLNLSIGDDADPIFAAGGGSTKARVAGAQE